MPRSRRLRAVAAHFELLGSAASGGDGPVGGELPLRPSSRQGPLAGFRVLDMSAVISGPWGASILADQGADVIKIEGPAGPDLTRGLGSSPAEGMAGMYTTYIVFIIHNIDVCKVYKLRKQSDLLLGPPPLPERERKLSRVYLS